jgi:hypothetical protein
MSDLVNSLVNRTPDNVLCSVRNYYDKNRDSILEKKAIYYLKKNYKTMYFKKLRLICMNLFDSQRIIKQAIKNNKLIINLDGEIVSDIDDFINRYNFNLNYKYIEADYKILDDDVLEIKIHKHFLLEQ